MAFRTFDNQEQVALYAQSLDTRWPERFQIAQHILAQIMQMPYADPHVVEFCTGPGMLAETLLAGQASLRYTGLDISDPLLTYAQARLAPYRDRLELIEADLNADEWPPLVKKPVHAAVTMQSLHDLGDESHVARIYAMARTLLTPGGLFINADLLDWTVQEPGTNPGRLSTERHMELLTELGFVEVTCSLQLGGFGCFVATVAA
jgi:cyclopropane fatty-acyl-phospholipid synthase-like methyltransferase